MRGRAGATAVVLLALSSQPARAACQRRTATNQCTIDEKGCCIGQPPAQKARRRARKAETKKEAVAEPTPAARQEPEASPAAVESDEAGADVSPRIDAAEQQAPVEELVTPIEVPVNGTRVPTSEADRREVPIVVAPYEPVAVPAPAAPERWRSEIILRAGAGALMGVLGIGLEYRPLRWLGAGIGTGTYAVSGGLSLHPLPDPLGFAYLDVHGVWAKPGLFTHYVREGWGLGATAGVDLRFGWFSLKAGTGPAVIAFKATPNDSGLARTRIGLALDCSLGVILP